MIDNVLMYILAMVIIVVVLFVVGLKPRNKYRNYKEYLKTDHWKITRAAALRRAGYKCEICGSNKRLNVHHLTYRNIGNERPEDLMVLCYYHHKWIHHK